ncbi:bactofilin family protein [Teredinibacter haidensis]|uniref:bactofilin family protein n=1 Tax=Teredinibacter haidensis TaxID=2731755 RepID=UPI000948F55E|nr:polymer-forming cytoskeletal protein [Teredinibacter haidensis]
MFAKKKDNPFAQGGHTLFDNALEITGDVHFGGTLDIEGTVKGNITAETNGDALVRVRAKGEVTGEIHAPKIIINGHVHGDVYCSKHLELAANAVVNGDVHYKVIEMVKGAQVNGKLVHIVEDAVAKPEAVKSTAPAKAGSVPATKASA